MPLWHGRAAREPGSAGERRGVRVAGALQRIDSGRRQCRRRNVDTLFRVAFWIRTVSQGVRRRARVRVRRRRGRRHRQRYRVRRRSNQVPLRRGNRCRRLRRRGRAVRHQALLATHCQRVRDRVDDANWHAMYGMGGGDVRRPPASRRRGYAGGERVRKRVQHQRSGVCVPASGSHIFGASSLRSHGGRWGCEDRRR